MESQHFGHEHPLAFNEELSNQCIKVNCSRCDEVMSGPSFSCMECEFFLHKKCAEAPSEIYHPFHGNHPLALLPKPVPEYYGNAYICNFCGMHGRKFNYRCSCKIDLHIKCALFTYNIAKKNLGELEHIALKDPLISTGNNNEELGSAKCYGCWKPLLDSVYFDTDCGFNLHKKCAEPSLEIDCLSHRKHPLILQFAGELFSCKVCNGTQLKGFVYGCSLCNFALHIQCLSPPTILEDKSHEHPFTLLRKEASFICNICGTQGNCFPCVCCTCDLMVHMKCISLPQAIKMTLHDHPILRTYFLGQNELKECVCIICQEEVNAEYGSYYCSICGFIVHVNCATQIEEWYNAVDLENKDDNLSSLEDISMDSIIEVIERNETGEATKIRHFSHGHDLLLNDKIVDNDKLCDGCTLFISSSFFYCTQCDFLLHKFCAELPKKNQIWFHFCRDPDPILTSDGIFKCYKCDHVSNGFAYKCRECEEFICLNCAIPFVFKHEGHEHPLFFDFKYNEQCNCCGRGTHSAYKCKRCNFGLDIECVMLPPKIRHKCDKHILILTCDDDNDYPENHYCDICEEKRDSHQWFYNCEICDTSAHTKCVLLKYPFFKPGRTYEEGNHPHPLTFVKTIHYYPDCIECCRPCQGLSLECIESGCNYIVHWDCVCPPVLKES